MDTEKVIRYLKELDTIELFASETYPQYSQQSNDPEIRKTLAEFGRDSERHRVIVSDLIEDLGGGRNTLRELGTTSYAWGMGLMTTVRRGKSGDLQNLQDLLFVEYRDRFHWYILRTVAESTGDQRLTEAVNTVLPDEEKHVSYLEGKVTELARSVLAPVRA